MIVQDDEQMALAISSYFWGFRIHHETHIIQYGPPLDLGSTLYAWGKDSVVKPTPFKSLIRYFKLAPVKLNKNVKIKFRS